ncbi:nuclear transport factor 2 family protein [Pelosinus propionicus]|uniref:SnoaL-like domain-containing protein n=1 Tax=Pelosinus propionicus DSM 13327 TaxID=1123291 RepID=A0A1I4NIW9_9FIRM|nr:nuclear transport factor 2 family protein [Pelosinus propionicus]SFM15411.1 SnoaL-like domain-containing protein [Pelosinus propionicus DSM 13327]
MKRREDKIQEYFNLWLTKEARQLKEIFANEVFYNECYGPEYHGINQILQWFNDWNKRGTVLQWRVKHFIHEGNCTVAEWYFECDFDGVRDEFNGVSIILFNSDEKIVSLKEFQSKSKHYQPFGETR